MLGINMGWDEKGWLRHECSSAAPSHQGYRGWGKEGGGGQTKRGKCHVHTGDTPTVGGRALVEHGMFGRETFRAKGNSQKGAVGTKCIGNLRRGSWKQPIMCQGEGNKIPALWILVGVGAQCQREYSTKHSSSRQRGQEEERPRCFTGL